MTERLYFSSDALEVETSVSSCTALDDGRYRVVLSATLFHPQGGGQPSDRETIGHADLIHVVPGLKRIRPVSDLSGENISE